MYRLTAVQGCVVHMMSVQGVGLPVAVEELLVVGSGAKTGLRCSSVPSARRS